MRSIKLVDLKPGMRFDKPVYVDGVNLLVPEGIPVKEKDLDRLRRWNITEVSTDGQIIDAGTGAKVGRTGAAVLPKSATTQNPVGSLYSRLAQRLTEIHAALRRNETVSSVDIDAIIDSLLSSLRTNKNDMIQFMLYGLQGESGFVENALNCSVLSALVGMNMNMVQHKLLQMTTGALLHDVGMLRLPEAIVSKKGELTREERQVIATHPVHSYKIITREMKYPEEIGMVALQHQERWDGAGYPKGLAGKDIVLPARIVAVADSFEAMVSTRPYRNSMIGYAAMRAVLSDNGRRFDPAVLKIFIRTMGIYPVGSIVLLSDGCVGRVVETNADSPLRPQVKVMVDEHGNQYKRDEGEIIDLVNDKKVFIARAVDPKEPGSRRE